MTDTRICFIGDSFVNGIGDEKMLGWEGRVCANARQNQRIQALSDAMQTEIVKNGGTPTHIIEKNL